MKQYIKMFDLFSNYTRTPFRKPSGAAECLQVFGRKTTLIVLHSRLVWWIQLRTKHFWM